MKGKRLVLGAAITLGLLAGSGCMGMGGGGCGGGGSTSNPPASATKTYVCPMHPEVVRNEPGYCPKCGMKLEEKTDGGGGHKH